MKDTTKVAALLAELKAQMTTEQEQEIVLNCEKQLKFSINEKWRDIKEYEGIYQVSNMGRIRSHKSGKWKILKGYKSSNYLAVTLAKGETSRKYYIHVLVARAFIPNPENKPEVNHKLGNRYDNRVSELEWATRSEQMKHAVRLGLNKPPIKSKLTDEQVKYIRRHYKYRSSEFNAHILAKKFKVGATTIYQVIHNVTHQNIN